QKNYPLLMRKNSGGLNMLNPVSISKRFYFEEILTQPEENCNQPPKGERKKKKDKIFSFPSNFIPSALTTESYSAPPICNICKPSIQTSS
ncbi:MAG: hypothetical protein QW035_04675, partial [Candidatus Anstonellales archaeon]